MLTSSGVEPSRGESVLVRVRGYLVTSRGERTLPLTLTTLTLTLALALTLTLALALALALALSGAALRLLRAQFRQRREGLPRRQTRVGDYRCARHLIRVNDVSFRILQCRGGSPSTWDQCRHTGTECLAHRAPTLCLCALSCDGTFVVAGSWNQGSRHSAACHSLRSSSS